MAETLPPAPPAGARARAAGLAWAVAQCLADLLIATATGSPSLSPAPADGPQVGLVAMPAMPVITGLGTGLSPLLLVPSATLYAACSAWTSSPQVSATPPAPPPTIPVAAVALTADWLARR